MTIYAAKPWTAKSSAIVAFEPASGGLPEAGSREGLNYFLEVFIARDFLSDWESGLDKHPSPAERCERLIRFAIDDA
jgi:hypothetical protein